MKLSHRTSNLLRYAGLRIEDLAYIDPKLCLAIRNFGDKAYHECLAELKAKGLEPGKWTGTKKVQYFCDNIPYYVEHREEIREEMRKEAVGLANERQAESDKKVSKEINTYRSETLRLIACSLLQNYSNCNLLNMSSEHLAEITVKHAAAITDMLIEEIKK